MGSWPWGWDAQDAGLERQALGRVGSSKAHECSNGVHQRAYAQAVYTSAKPCARKSTRRHHRGRPVRRPPRKKPKPKTQSQWGQEYITSFFRFPTTSLRTGNASDSVGGLAPKLTGFLQCGHFAIFISLFSFVLLPDARRAVEIAQVKNASR